MIPRGLRNDLSEDGEIEYKNNEITSRDEELERKDEVIVSKDEQIASLKAKLESTQKQLKELKDDKKASLSQIKEYVADKNEENDRKPQAVPGRITINQGGAEDIDSGIDTENGEGGKEAKMEVKIDTDDDNKNMSRDDNGEERVKHQSHKRKYETAETGGRKRKSS